VDNVRTPRARTARIATVRAYLDESLRLTGSGLYVLAAVAVPPARADAVRETLRGDPLRRRYHWHDENRASRTAMAGEVRALGLEAVAVVTRPVEAKKSERARRRCLLRLLWELSERGVSDVLIESRQRRDKYDRHIIACAQRSGQVAPGLRYGFEPPLDECLLWLPDVVAGATARAFADGDRTFLDLLGATVVTVP
jgi:hypothetical protein